ncbi:MAG: ATP-binding cassette domain-containing protein, partial [Pseudomonadota bacterium]
AYNPILMLFAGSGLFRLADTSRQNIDDFYAEAEPWLVDRQTKSDKPQNHIHDSKARYDIVFDKVCFQYPGSDAGVSNISFTAKNGKLTAIVGPSGAGKSTLFHLLSRFWQVQSGSIQIGDIDIYDIPESIVSKTMSQVSQDVVLINDSLRNNVTLGIQDYSDEAVIKALTLANMTNLLRRLPEGLESKLGEGGAQLSGGEKQRITIARALLRDSPIVMLDEAMSSIDPTNAREIQQSIMELSRGKTLIVIAHRLSSIIGADNIIVMDKGEIQALGTHEQLLKTSPLYQTLWKEHCSAKSWTIVE